jgi:hypothetical protein
MTAASDAKPSTRIPFFSDLQLVIVVLLGIVSVATAYASFEAALYGGQQASSYSKGGALQTEAESIYLEANQQFVQDSQTIQQLAVLQVAADAGDTVAAAQWEELYFVGVSEDLAAAIDAAAALDESEPEFWHDPQADEDYQAALFGSYGEQSIASEDLRKEGDALGYNGDLLSLYTTLMAVSLFLLGIAAVLKRPLMQWVLIATGGAIFLVTAILTAMVPFVTL